MIALLELRPYTGDHLAPSPNHGARRSQRIEGIVLHATADEGDEALTLSWLRSPRSRVSCHLLVGRTGRVTRLVGDQQRAWHAGVAWWRGTTDVNSITLGIEIANRNDGEPFTHAQYRRVAAIVAHYCRQGLSLGDVVSHAAIAEGRRTDPLGWDWGRFRAMVAHRLRPPPESPPVASPAPRSGSEGVPGLPTLVPRVVPMPAQRVPLITLPKPLWHSRTLWLNGMTVLASGGLLVSDTLDLAHRAGIVVAGDVTKWALFAVGLVNVALRLGTTRPLACRLRLRGSPLGSSPDCADESPVVTEVALRQGREGLRPARSGRRILPVRG